MQLFPAERTHLLTIASIYITRVLMDQKWRKMVARMGFGGDDATPEDFIRFKCSGSRVGYFVYRSVWTIVFVSCFIAHIAWSVVNEKFAAFFFYLTHWVELIVLSYFLTSFAVALRGYLRQTKKVLETPPSDDGGKLLIRPKNGMKIPSPANHFSVVLKMQARNLSFENKVKGELSETNLKWFHKASWLLHELAFIGSYTVSLIYWGFLSRRTGTTNLLLNLYQHGLGCIAITIDALVSRYPCRLLHAVYGCIVGIFYVFFSFILHLIATKYDPQNLTIPNKVYWFLDWDSGSFLPLYLCLIMLPVTFVIQGFLVLLNIIRKRCYSE